MSEWLCCEMDSLPKSRKPTNQVHQPRLRDLDSPCRCLACLLTALCKTSFYRAGLSTALCPCLAPSSRTGAHAGQPYAAHLAAVLRREANLAPSREGNVSQGMSVLAVLGALGGGGEFLEVFSMAFVQSLEWGFHHLCHHVLWICT